MTQEEKDLVFKDICARTPYNAIVRNIKLGYDGYVISPAKYQPLLVLTKYLACGVDQGFSPIEDIRPYLRPMSSMTDDERDEFRTLGGVMSHNVQNDTWAICAFSPEAYDWLNKKGFDYRGLIPMGLALEAKEGMYKIQ